MTKKREKVTEFENEALFVVHIMQYTTSRAEPGLYLRRGTPLRNDVNSVSCPSHVFVVVVVFRRILLILESHLRRGGAHTLHPSPRSTPEH